MPKFINNIDLDQNQILNSVLEKSVGTSSTASTVEAQYHYDLIDNKFKYRTPNGWRIPAIILSDLENVEEVGLTSGSVLEYNFNTNKWIGTASKVSFITVDEGNGPGFVVRTLDRTNYVSIGKGSLDLSVGDSNLVPRGIIGDQSFGIGFNILGSGYGSITSGLDCVTNGNYSLNVGVSNIIGGTSVSTLGVALDTTGAQFMSCFGQANTLPGNLYSLQVGNGSLIIGTGVSANIRSDSFRIYKDGGVEAPSLTTNIINNLGTHSLITKEYMRRYVHKWSNIMKHM